MLSKPSFKLIIFGVIWLVILSLAGYVAVKIIRLPQTNPDKILEIEAKVINFFQQITLPIKIAKLSLLEADKQLLMPVYGHRIFEIADSWHAPRSEGRVHEGQDIFASRGTPVFSATNGYVIRMTSGSLVGGNTVYVVGAGRVRYYYAHLDRLAEGLNEGDKVTTDTVIGFVGNTGNAETTPPHLHFGVYVSREAVDPLPLLVDR